MCLLKLCYVFAKCYVVDHFSIFNSHQRMKITTNKGGCKPIHGATKFSANKWVRTKPFRSPGVKWMPNHPRNYCFSLVDASKHFVILKCLRVFLVSEKNEHAQVTIETMKNFAFLFRYQTNTTIIKPNRSHPSSSHDTVRSNGWRQRGTSR